MEKFQKILIVLIVVLVLLLITVVAILIYVYTKPCTTTENDRFLPGKYIRDYSFAGNSISTQLHYSPYVAAVVYNANQTLLCLGAIISVTWVLTTSQCIIDSCDLFSTNHLSVYTGNMYWDREFNEHQIKKCFKQKEFRSADLNIGCIAVWEPFVRNHEKIIMVSDTSYKITANSVGVISSWPVKDSVVTEKKFQTARELLNLDVNIYSDRVCKIYSKKSYIDNTTNRIFCSNWPNDYENTCIVPQGAPLIQNQVLIGLLVHADCKNKKIPLIYINISSVLDVLYYIQLYLNEDLELILSNR